VARTSLGPQEETGWERGDIGGLEGYAAYEAVIERQKVDSMK
jgi:hypothetical protein